VGWVVDGQERQFADAILTNDGRIRIHISDSYSAGSGVIPNSWDRSAQFVGRLFVRDGVVRGSGRLLGEGCALPSPIRFCGAPAKASLELQPGEQPGFDRLLGIMKVKSAAGVEIWQVVLDPWRLYYKYVVSPRMLEGLYSETTAEFARAGETILDVNTHGRVFFQSPVNNCVGNGTMTPRADVGVVDVEMRIENCQGRFAYLNGRYRGFSTFSQSDYWGYDSVLRTWLAKPTSAAEPAAITMWSIPR
jgi:hypothetical protein